ncbi:uncharacterized protein [Haliotis asinina]|uniref:uncharacterized protein n=1 Tax=Haliotis asinina TaxID=109174 RepID=UPI0035322050
MRIIQCLLQKRKFLRFEWQGILYEYTCLPNGLACAPRRFTKLLKPAYATLRQQGCTVVPYLDDSYLQGDTKVECADNVRRTVTLLQDLGFIIHAEKSKLVPTQEIEFLGFVLNSVFMTIRLAPEKAQRVKLECSVLSDKQYARIQEVAHVIGLLVSSFPGVQYGQLHYRELEQAKTVALKRVCGNYDATMIITQAMRDNLDWWVEECDTPVSPEAEEGEGGSNHGAAELANAALVRHGAEDAGGSSSFSAAQDGPAEVAAQQLFAPVEEKAATSGMPLIREALTLRGIPERIGKVITQSWCGSTQRQYQVHLHKWEAYCSERDIDPLQGTVAELLGFLHVLYEQGLSYSSLNTARSAVSALVSISSGISVGSDPLVCRFLKGVFQQRPTRSRYKNVWDVSTVFTYIDSLGRNCELTLKYLTLKLTVLLALATANRLQSLQTLDILNMKMMDNKIVFVLNRLKQRTPGRPAQFVDIDRFETESNLCVYRTLRAYLDATLDLRGEEKQVLISFQKPHKKVGTSTIARWIRQVLAAAGIDTSVFCAHSTRAAASSAASVAQVPITDILRTAGWTSGQTFAKHYRLPVDTGTSNISKTMGMTNAERQRKFRANRDKDPARRQAYLEAGRKRYSDDKEKGLRKSTKELPERERRQLRRKWKKQKRVLRAKQKIVAEMITPPMSPLSPRLPLSLV